MNIPMNRVLPAFGLAILLVACGDTTTPSGDTATKPVDTEGVVLARAQLRPTDGHEAKGQVTFRRFGEVVRVEVEMEGLEPGSHGFHVHEHGDCSAPDASSAGGHFNPTNQPHGAPGDEGRHIGDLGNIEADENGRVNTVIDDRLLMLNGDHSIVGKAVVVHAGADDLTSQPSGDAGARIACGLIEPVEPAQ